MAQAATSTIPIIFATANDPVEDGLVKSINRPGGNSTGTHLFNNALAPKRLEVLRGLVPNSAVVGFVVNPDSPTTGGQIRRTEEAARSFAIELIVVQARDAGEIEAAFATLSTRGVQALVMGADPLFQVYLEQVIALAARHALPTIYEWSEFVRAGGLVAYSVDRIEMWRQLGLYVGLILNGANPAELPIIQPTKFELVVNLKTAHELGLKVPESFLQFADEVIE